MLTPKEYAKQIQAAYSTVMSRLQRDLIPGAEKQELPSGGWYYTVPADAPKPQLKPGPKPKTDDQVEAQANEAKPKGRASKRSPAKKANVTMSAKKKGARAKGE
ncbi:MAG TPA: hypothetical protein VJ810_29895 [Blastocatellia bacterium]|nr:hypothetical protein [Blastocatellia bacterium]